MDPTIGWLAVIAGVLIIGLVATKKISIKGPMMLLVVLVAAGMIIYPFSSGTISTSDITGQITPTPTPISTATWDLVVTNNGGAITPTISEDYLTVTVPLTVNSTSGVVSSRTCYLTIVATPIPPAGADTTQLVTLGMSSEYLTKYSGEEVFTETANKKTVTFYNTVIGTKYYSASQSTIYTTPLTVYYNVSIDSGSTSWATETTAVGQGFSWNVMIGGRVVRFNAIIVSYAS